MNIFKNKKLIATVLTFVIFMALMQQPLLTAKERRGSTVVVAMTDGSQVKGELLAVKSDVLLVYDRDAGQGKSINLQQVVHVKVLKKSKFLQDLATGYGVGLGIGVFINGIYSGDPELVRLYSLVLPSMTALCGGLVGALSGIPEIFSLDRESSQAVQKNLERLKRYAREQDIEKTAAPVRHRFRLLWSPGEEFPSGKIDFHSENGTFHFVNNATSKDTDVYFYKPGAESFLKGILRAGEFRLEYEFTPHFSTSLEFIASGKLDDVEYENELSFYSSDYAKRYRSFEYFSNQYSYDSLLLGVNWKVFPTAFARKQVIEFGIAAGPALAQANLDCTFSKNSNSQQIFKTVTWSGKAHVAYDFVYTHNFSLGVLFAYRYLRASFPGATFFNEKREFWTNDNYRTDYLTRPTEFTIPRYSIHLGGIDYCLRVGLRF